MQMTLRWFGDKFDSVKLWQIRQIPGVTGVITTLYDIPAGEVWPVERIKALQKEVEDAGLTIAGIESVNIHDAIKIGNADRDKYIENYITTLDNLGQCGIKLVCYNFMPVFDWTRTDLAKMRPDGSTVLAYDQKVVDSIDPQKFFDQTNDNSNGFVMPGWEPERLSKVKELFEAYKDVDEDMLFNNLVYFLKGSKKFFNFFHLNHLILPAAARFICSPGPPGPAKNSCSLPDSWPEVPACPARKDICSCTARSGDSLRSWPFLSAIPQKAILPPARGAGAGSSWRSC